MITFLECLFYLIIYIYIYNINFIYILILFYYFFVLWHVLSETMTRFLLINKYFVSVFRKEQSVFHWNISPRFHQCRNSISEHFNRQVTQVYYKTTNWDLTWKSRTLFLISWFLRGLSLLCLIFSILCMDYFVGRISLLEISL